MPKKKKEESKIYFTQDTEDAIIEYNKTSDLFLRNKLYVERIKYPFEKLAENVLNTFKFSYFDVPSQDIQTEVVSTLMEKIHMFKEGRGKAFSYFSIVAKNHLILKNNGNFKRFKQTSVLSEMPEGWNPGNDFYEREVEDDYNEFNELMLEWWDKHLTTVFVKKRDIQIADSVLELFRRSSYIENFNKKHLYLLVREMTNCKTHYITKVVNIMKVYQIQMLNQYLEYGHFNVKPEQFWQETYIYDEDDDSDFEQIEEEYE
jgi:uncharacterized C2H2 Zn-finger protein